MLRPSGAIAPAPGCPRLSKLTLPVRLALLVTGTMLPLIVFAVGIVFYNYKQDRNDATRRVLENVRSMRLVLDSEVQRMTGGLQVLALTNSLRNDDFENFRRIALGFVEQYGKGGLVLISDRKGRLLFSSATEDTASLPRRGHIEIIERVFATRSPQYSDLFTGAINGRQVLTVEVPVIRDGEVIYDLAFSPPIRIFQELVEKQRPDQFWTVSLLDTKGTVFARVPNPTETVGKQASGALSEEMSRTSEAALSTVSLDGVALSSAFTRSHLTGWMVVAGVAESSLIAPLWRNVAITSLIGGILLLTGLTFAVRMATTIARGEMLHNLLIEELNHRVKNTLALMQAIAVQTFRSASRDERTKFEGRLGALAEAHNLLSQEKWAGSELRDVIARALQPFLLSNPDRIRLSGPAVPLSPRLAVVLSMIVHEIATNAAKYGALSSDTGRVTLDWEVITEAPKPRLRLIWTEIGGPPVTAPVRRGFGSRLIERSARDQLGGEATVDFLPRGVVCTVICTLDETR
ncbi:two-component sensor histidine kinase [Bradyrhizobium daqingense]|uniref:histidine kinase n=2 Tax=Bradyrhizobium daqingense TaxID=993502 RepID=A0A562LV20_9BRAD|nr:two-component sensor histidine kinase [Bradyrhizobium daqingense]